MLAAPNASAFERLACLKRGYGSCFLTYFCTNPMSRRDAHRKKARRFGQNDMRHRNLFHGRRKLAREHVDRDDRGGLRVRENMRHFMRRIERVDIDEHASRFENAECGDRIGEPVWNLDRDPGSRLKAQRFAQIGGEGVRIAIDFRKAQACRHAVRHDGGKRPGRRLPRR